MPAAQAEIGPLYLIDTNVVSEFRKRERMNSGVRHFLDMALASDDALYLSVISIGELRQGTERLRYRGDIPQAEQLETWLATLIGTYSERILDFDLETAQVWGRLRVPYPENAINKQIAAIALSYDLTLVSRNYRDFQDCGVRILNPFQC